MRPRRRILVVERDDGERSGLQSLLESEYDVSAVEAGDRAVALLGREDYDLVILGGVGEEDGAGGLVPALGCLVFRPKVILLTPAFSREVVDRAARVRADGVLPGGRADEVTAAVAAHLGS
jgi:DNA-binding response OmpR family regulator